MTTKHTRGVCLTCDSLFRLPAPGRDDAYCSEACAREYVIASLDAATVALERTERAMERTALALLKIAANLRAIEARGTTPRAA